MTEYKVERAGGDEMVTCDYVRIENGHLIFRTHGKTYPEIVMSYAPGEWRSLNKKVGA